MFYEIDGNEFEPSLEEKDAAKEKPLTWNPMFSWGDIVGAVKKTSEQVAAVIKEDLHEIAEAGQEFVRSTTEAMEPVAAKVAETDFESKVGEYVGKAEKLTFGGISKLGTGIAMGLNSLFLAEEDPAKAKAKM
jgi:hypothetical protein